MRSGVIKIPPPIPNHPEINPPIIPIKNIVNIILLINSIIKYFSIDYIYNNAVSQIFNSYRMYRIN